MEYKILKIVKVSDDHYDVDYEEVCWLRKPKTFKTVRTEFSSILGVIVSTGAMLHNFKQVLEAYDYSGTDFTLRDEPLPRVHTTVGKAIY